MDRIEYLLKMPDLGTERPTWRDFCMYLAIMASFLSTCLKYKVGAVFSIDKSKQLLNIGYNGAVKKDDHCTDLGTCEKDQGAPNCKGAHAEINVISNCSNNGVKVSGATLYCTLSPCHSCAKAIVNAGIVKVVYLDLYSKEPESSNALKFLEKMGIIVESFDPEWLKR